MRLPRPILRPVQIQVLLLTVITWFFVAPKMISDGINIVTITYQWGAERFFAGGNAYELPIPGGDRFEYSPFFCLVYYPFAVLPSSLQAALWAFFNCLLFWSGVSAWYLINKKAHVLVIAAVILCSIELNISLLYQQINAALAGVILLAVALYREKKYFSAGALLTVAANIKIFPLVFALALLFPIRKNYLAGCIIASVICLLSPALIAGPEANITSHIQWYNQLLETANMTRPDQLDLKSVFSLWGQTHLGNILVWIVGICSLLALFFLPQTQPIPWRGWFSLSITGLLLSSPRSESPTFVLMAPVYIFLALELRHWALISLFFVGAFFTSFCFTDAWPNAVWDPPFQSKTAGALSLWALALAVLLKPKRVIQ